MNLATFKALILTGSILLLSGCLAVGDIRPAWNSAGMLDPELNGTWINPDPDSKRAPFLAIRKEGDVYMVDEMDESQNVLPIEGGPYQIRTVGVGQNKYMLIISLAAEGSEGYIVPYKIQDRVLTTYELKPCESRKCTEDLREMAFELRKRARDFDLGYGGKNIPVLNARALADFDTLFTTYMPWKVSYEYKKL